MMREIKFRAWDEENCEMVYFNNRRLTADEYQRAHLAMLLAGDYGDVLMQYTGLKDRNGTGNEMCQGDIVFAAGLGFGVVNRNRWGEWGLVINDGFESIHDLMMECDLGSIIGNIHENPELLECEA